MNIPPKPLLSLLTACCLLLLCAKSAAQTKNNPSYTVVIDAGHGGKDPGAVYGGAREKDINLAVALRFGKLVSENCPDVRVIYTRTTDVFLGLDERGTIANKAGADLFISLHADAVDRNSAANGATTYIMGMDKTQNNLKEAMRENAVMKYEEDYSQKYEGFDPTSAESYIIFSLMQYAYFDRSLRFANIIQKHYAVQTRFANRGAKQGPFYVLWKPAMPSVLTEMGFVSNETDRKYITSEKGQGEIARALYESFREYREGDRKTAGQGSPDTVGLNESPGTAGRVENPEPSGQGVQESAKGGEAVPDIGFYVQLSASRTSIGTSDRSFGKWRGRIVEKKADGWYKYYIGGFRDLKEAAGVRDEVKRDGFRDAFVIALEGDRQITIEEALRRIAGGK